MDLILLILDRVHRVHYVNRSDRVAKVSDLKQVKILTSKQMLQRFPIALEQVKASNTSENVLNEIRAKEITKYVYSNIMNSIKL